MSLRDALLAEKSSKELAEAEAQKNRLREEQAKSDRFYVWAVLLLGSQLISELQQLGISMNCTGSDIRFSRGKRVLCVVPNWLAVGYDVKHYDRYISYSTGCGWTAWSLRDLTREKLAYNIATQLGGIELLHNEAQQ